MGRKLAVLLQDQRAGTINRAKPIPVSMFSFLLVPGLVAMTALADWPQWRGVGRDGHATSVGWEPSTLPKEAKAVWKVRVGPGHSSPIVFGNRVVYLDESEGQEFVHCLDRNSGRSLWKSALSSSYQDEWGAGPRSTPFVDADRVYAQSCNGEFRCLSLEQGRTIWRVNFEDFGVKFLGSKAQEGTASRRGNTGSGLIDGPRVIVPVGSTSQGTLFCFDKLTGKVLWKALRDEAAYSSPVLASPGGIRQVIHLTAEGLAGVHAETGEALWQVPLKTAAKRHAATPVVYGNKILVNSYSIGVVCIELAPRSGKMDATIAWQLKDQKINIASPVLVGQHLYSQGANKDFVCVDVAAGALKWAQAGFGLGGKKDYSSTIALGRRLLVLTEDGQLLLLDANPDQFRELARLQVCGNTWSHPAYAGGRLYVRDGRELACFDLRGTP